MESPTFVQYLFLAIDPAWRRLATEERECARAELRELIEGQAGISTHAYSTTGLKAGTDILLWRTAPELDELQTATSEIFKCRLGGYLSVPYTYIGLIRPSTYVRRQDAQEQAALEKERARYLVIYPFTKTHEWYQMGKASRQGMMNEHIKIGHEYPNIRQVLVHSTGLDDQEFVVAYEMDTAAELLEFQTLVMELRSTDGRPYTLRDTPVFTAVHRPLGDVLSLVSE
ncbi:MAG TPA: chlorite dismutase family protein [Chloroflexota bacterium]|jgi:chlorite dismutase|nr:chlorite dismutase family protein [Chloroflexota bacterium]